MEKVTITDIAKMVGVSTATVSYYIRGNFKKMSETTREKIKAAIEETGYQPSKVAQSLVMQDTQTIGVVIADITNPFTASMTKGIYDACHEKGYAISFTQSDNDLYMEQKNLQLLLQQKVSGIILDSVEPNQTDISLFGNKQMVLVDRQAKTLQVDTVVSDNVASTKAFLTKMQATGYKDIYFVSFPFQDISTRELRYQGFCEAVTDQPDHLLILGEDGLDKRLSTIIKTSSNKPAFFMMNGLTLLEFMKLVHDLPFSYPQDFGIGAYEDLEWMSVLQPGISCIRQDSYRIGKIAAERLITKLTETESYYPELLEVKNELIFRQSF